MSDQQEGLVFAYVLDGQGGGREAGWNELRDWRPESGFLWAHVDYSAAAVQQWLEEESGIDPLIVEALIAEETRPRSLTAHDGLLVILRGVNLNPGADPEDMVALRVWVESGRAVSMRRRRVMAVQDVEESIASCTGPTGPADLIVQLADRLVLRMGAVLSELDETVDTVEETLLESQPAELRGELAQARRQSIGLRRYLAPQRDALSRLQTERVSWMGEMDRAHLREITDRTTRYVEDLDSARDRAAVAHEELNARVAEQMNRRMYALSIVAGIFLPLSFLTGLLGINVGGIPGTDSPMAFSVVCALLVGVAGLQFWLFRSLRWL